MKMGSPWPLAWAVLLPSPRSDGLGPSSSLASAHRLPCLPQGSPGGCAA